MGILLVILIGEVINVESGEGIVGFLIIVICLNGVVIGIVISGENGNFLILNLLVGLFIVIV